MQYYPGMLGIQGVPERVHSLERSEYLLIANYLPSMCRAAVSSCGERKPNSNAAGRLPFQQIVLVHNDDKQTLIDYRVKSVSASTRSPQVPPTWLYTLNSLII